MEILILSIVLVGLFACIMLVISLVSSTWDSLNKTRVSFLQNEHIVNELDSHFSLL